MTDDIKPIVEYVKSFEHPFVIWLTRRHPHSISLKQAVILRDQLNKAIAESVADVSNV